MDRKGGGRWRGGYSGQHQVVKLEVKEVKEGEVKEVIEGEVNEVMNLEVEEAV